MRAPHCSVGERHKRFSPWNRHQPGVEVASEIRRVISMSPLSNSKMKFAPLSLAKGLAAALCLFLLFEGILQSAQISVNNVSVTEGDSSATNAVFVVILSETNAETVTVDYTTADGSATSGLDYEAVSGMVTFPPGVTEQFIVVAVQGDTLDEVNETFRVDLANPTNATLSTTQAIGTIGDDDPAPAISITDAAVVEGDSGTTNAVFTITLSPASGQTVSVEYATADGTASAESDYASHSGTVTFLPGTTNQIVTVPVNGDVLNEANETFFVNLLNPVQATVARSQGIGTIGNDDPLPSVSIDDVTVIE